MNPDAIARRYLAVTESCSVRALSLWVATGTYCASCPPGLSGKPRSNKRGDKWYCDRCNKPWEPRSQWVLKSGIPRGHPDTHRFRFERVKGKLRRVVEPRYAARPGPGHPTPRSDSVDLRLADHVDRVRHVQALVETVPRPLTPAAWCFDVSAWLVYLMLETPPAVKPFPGYTGCGLPADRVAEWGTFLRPHLGPWNVDTVTRGVAEARAWVRWRAQTPRWPLEETMSVEDWVPLAEAAKELGMEPRTLRRWIDAGAIRKRYWRDWRRPDAPRARYVLSREWVENARRQRIESGDLDRRDTTDTTDVPRETSALSRHESAFRT